MDLYSDGYVICIDRRVFTSIRYSMSCSFPHFSDKILKTIENKTRLYVEHIRRPNPGATYKKHNKKIKK